MDELNENAFLEKEKLTKLMRKYAIPCIISLLVAALYNIVDQIFIANASYLGSYGNAANTVVFPLTVVALAIAVMIGDGCCAFVSICLGAKNTDSAHKSIGNSIVLSIACSVILTMIYFLFQRQILTAFGGSVNAKTWMHSQEYFTYISMGIPFYMFGQAMNPIIRSDGSPQFAMAATVAGAIVNIILDPIFIYIFKWGMMGAALATVLGQVLTAVISIWYLYHLKFVKLDKSSFQLQWRLMKKFLPLGICSFLSQISLILSMAAMQNMILKYGLLDPVFSQAQFSQIPMAVLGIVMKFFQIVISISVGMAAGCIPIVGYNVGAKRFDRAKKLFIYLLAGEALIGFVATLFIEFFPMQFIAIFGAAKESPVYTEFAIKSLRTYLCTMTLATFNKAAFIYLQSLGKALLYTALSMIREIIFGVGFALLLPVFFGLDGVLYSMPISDVLTFIISVICVIYILRLLENDHKKTQIELK